MKCASSYAYIQSKKNFISKKAPKVDTNVISIKFDSLKEAENNIFLGDPIFCHNCRATLSCFSKLLTADEYSKYLTSLKPTYPSSKENPLGMPNMLITESNILTLETNIQNIKPKSQKKEFIYDPDDDEIEEEKEPIILPHLKSPLITKKIKTIELSSLKNDEKIWICEFCSQHNKLQIEPQEIPQVSDVTYMLNSAEQLKKLNPLSSEGSDLSVIFCIDNSGSMGITTEIASKIELNYGLSEEERKMLEEFIEAGDEDQWLPNQNQNISYISRKQCVIAAIEQQLEEMSKNTPNRKVGIITFNNEVCIYGDGQSNPITIAGDKLYKYNVCMQEGYENYGQLMSTPISKSSSKILNKLQNLQEKGQTALGPALLSSLALASKGNPGSTVILCTDGIANKGLGEMETKEGEESSKEFYMKLGEFAKSKGIVVNVITIKGEGCKLENLGKICELTNGKVTRVNPDNIAEDFSNILKDEILGTKLEMKVRLHNSLYFRNEKSENLSQDKSYFTKSVGNVNANTEITLEYECKNESELASLGIEIDSLKEIPFQAQITYLSRNNHSLMRVITKMQKITKDLQEAEKDLNFRLLATRQTQYASELAQNGDLIKAKKYNKNWDEYITSNLQKNIEKDSKYKKEFLVYQDRNTKLNKVINNRAKINIKNNKKLRKSRSRSRGRSGSRSKNRSRSRSGNRSCDSEEESIERELNNEIRCLSREASLDECEADFFNFKQQCSDIYSDSDN